MKPHPQPTCHHYCNEPLRCPECVRRFWKWAESHTRGRLKADVGGKVTPEAHGSGFAEGVTFYEAAGAGRVW